MLILNTQYTPSEILIRGAKLDEFNHLSRFATVSSDEREEGS